MEEIDGLQPSDYKRMITDDQFNDMTDLINGYGWSKILEEAASMKSHTPKADKTSKPDALPHPSKTRRSNENIIPQSNKVSNNRAKEFYNDSGIEILSGIFKVTINKKHEFAELIHDDILTSGAYSFLMKYKDTHGDIVTKIILTRFRNVETFNSLKIETAKDLLIYTLPEEKLDPLDGKVWKYLQHMRNNNKIRQMRNNNKLHQIK